MRPLSRYVFATHMQAHNSASRKNYLLFPDCCHLPGFQNINRCSNNPQIQAPGKTFEKMCYNTKRRLKICIFTQNIKDEKRKAE